MSQGPLRELWAPPRRALVSGLVLTVTVVARNRWQ